MNTHQCMQKLVKQMAQTEKTSHCCGAGGQHSQSAFAPHAAHALPNGEPLEASALSNGDTPSQPPHPASYMEVIRHTVCHLSLQADDLHVL